MSAAQLFLPASRAFNSNGLPVAGAVLKLYTTGTLIPQPFYSDGALTVSLGSSVTANAAGRFQTVYQNNASPFRLRIEDSSGAEMDDIDPFYFGSMLVGTAYNAVTPQNYGALADGVTDDSAAFVAAIAALRAEALNTGGGGFYKGSRSLFVPAGHYYLGTTTIDINHTLIIQGEGSGQFGPAASGCTHLRWADGTDGLRVQAATTEGDTTVSGATHDGSGGVCLADMCLEGGFNGTTESDHHGLVVRNAIKAENLYIKNWPGEGVKAWAGLVTGFGSVLGNNSTSRLVGVKTENCRGGFDIRGTDSNVITLINCEGTANRQWGYLDDNGAGSNTVIGFHAASNGIVTGPWPQTQCSYSGNQYAAVWGGDPTIAPSGTTADTANWFYIAAGAPVVNLYPAWVNTASTFRAGGDYVTINSASVLLLNCYSEGGGFSQFNTNTVIKHGTIGSAYFRGGSRWFPAVDGLTLIVPPQGNLWLQTRTGETGLFARDENAVTFGYIDFLKTGGVYINGLDGVHLRKAGATVATADDTGFSLPNAQTFSINGSQLLITRRTGWTADTGTAKRTANATYAAGSTLTFSGTYVQAELTALATRLAAVEAALQNTSQTQKGVKDDLITHGIIGA